MSCRVSKGRRTTNGRRSLKLRLFGFKQSCFPQAVKKEIELGYNVLVASSTAAAGVTVPAGPAGP